MARLKFAITTGGEIALSAATAKTILQLRTPTNQAVAFQGFAVSFDGVSPTAEPVLVELCRYSSNGTMTSAAGVKDDPGRAETIQSVGVRGASLEPAVESVLRYWEVHPQTGYERKYEHDEELIIAGGTRLGLRCTAPANVNVAGYMNCEE